MLPLLKDKDADVRLACAASLGKMAEHAEAAIAGLIEALSDQQEKVAHAAALTPGSIGAKGEELLLLAARSGNVQARAFALLAIGQITPDVMKTLPILLAALMDKDPKVQLAALGTLGKYGPRAATAIEEVEKLVAGTIEEVRKAAESTLKPPEKGEEPQSAPDGEEKEC